MLVSEVELTPYCSIVRTANGAQVLCRRIPALLLKAFGEAHPEPKPPMAMVSVLGGHQVEEEDPDDPAYLAELELAQGQQSQDFLALALDFMFLLDEDEAQAKDRADRLVRWGIPNEGAYRVQAFALDEPEVDVETLSKELMRISTVTASEVAKTEDSFRPDLGRDGGDAVGDAEELDAIREADSDPVPGVPAQESSEA